MDSKLNRLIVVIIGCLVMLFIFRNKKPSTSEFDDESIKLEIQSMLTDYHDAIEEGGLLAEFDFLDNSTDFFWVPPGYHSALDYDSVKSILIENDKMFKTISFKWNDLAIYPLSEEIGSFTGWVTGTMIDTANAKTSVSILESGTVIKRNSGWKLLNGQSRIKE